MGILYLVRHGQASFGADEYDRLSTLGHRQAERLGAWLRAQGIVFEAALTGTLRRHAETFDGIVRGLGGWTAPAPLPRLGLDEYDGAALVAAVHAGPLPPADTPESRRAYFRLLRDGLGRWIDGCTAPAGMPTHADFVAGVVDALDTVRQRHTGNVLLVSSGGPIATAVCQVLHAPAATAIELNLQLRNSAVTEFVFDARRHRLQTFNGLSHLDGPEHRDWHSHV